jgi:hypothetical protein
MRIGNTATARITRLKHEVVVQELYAVVAQLRVVHRLVVVVMMAAAVSCVMCCLVVVFVTS